MEILEPLNYKSRSFLLQANPTLEQRSKGKNPHPDGLRQRTEMENKQTLRGSWDLSSTHVIKAEKKTRWSAVKET